MKRKELEIALTTYRVAYKKGYSQCQEDMKHRIKTNNKTNNMKPKKLYIYNGIENELEEISDLKEAKDYIKDYIQYASIADEITQCDIHPDIESIIILEKIGGVTLEETGEEIKLNGDVVPICKVDIFINKEITDNKYSEEDIINALHSVELKDNKDYSKIFEGMKEYLQSKQI